MLAQQDHGVTVCSRHRIRRASRSCKIFGGVGGQAKYPGQRLHAV